MSVQNEKTKRFTQIQYQLAYKAIVPDSMKKYFTICDFYSNLPIIVTEAYNEGFKITQIGKKIVKLRFVDNMKVADTKSTLGLNNKAYKEEWDLISRELRSFLITEVYDYPLRLIILKVKNLKQKTFLRKFYRSVPWNYINNCYISLTDYLKACHHQLKGHGHTKKGYQYIIDRKFNNYTLTKREINQLDCLFDIISSLCDKKYKTQPFLHYVKLKEGTTVSTLLGYVRSIESNEK